MRKFVSYTILIITVFSSCKEMDSEYRDYIVENGLTYPQKADSLKIYPGFNKLRLTWLRPRAPSVKYSMVYWNNYADSVKVNFVDDQDTIRIDIDSLEESSYSFVIKNFDEQGNVSIPAEVTGTPYGENYLISAADRIYTTATRDAENLGTIQWEPASVDLVYTEVKYKTTAGDSRTVRVTADEDLVMFAGIKPGEKFEYRSVFLPKNGIDSLAKSWQTSEAPFLYRYPRETWTAQARNGNHEWGDGGGGQPHLILDGDINTGWHSTPGAPLPQCVAVDMQESLTVDQLVLLPPARADWRYMQNVAIYLSNDPILPDTPQESWGDPVALATYNDGDRFTINFDQPRTGRYVAVLFQDSRSETFISFMELEIYGY